MAKCLNALLVGALLLNGCKSSDKPPSDPSPAPASPTATVTPLPSVAASAAPSLKDPVQPSESLNEKLAGKTPAQVEKLLGKPAAIYRQQDHESWYYQKPSTGPNGTLVYPEVRFADGKVRSVNHWDKSAMDDKVKTSTLNDTVEPVPVPRAETLDLDEFHKLAFGKNQDEILNNLGQPDNKKIVDGHEVWQYNGIVKHQDGPMTMTIEFENGVARHLQGS